jgi:hypothetical protein
MVIIGEHVPEFGDHHIAADQQVHIRAINEYPLCGFTDAPAHGGVPVGNGHAIDRVQYKGLPNAIDPEVLPEYRHVVHRFAMPAGHVHAAVGDEHIRSVAHAVGGGKRGLLPVHPQLGHDVASDLLVAGHVHIHRSVGRWWSARRRLRRFLLLAAKQAQREQEQGGMDLWHRVHGTGDQW